MPSQRTRRMQIKQGPSNHFYMKGHSIMNGKPKSLNEVLAEKRLAEWLDLPMTNSGRSRQLSNWIRGGLKYIEKSGRRYFLEKDVIEYLCGGAVNE